jgi:hypothetical protein
MPHDTKGFKELQSYNQKKRAEMNADMNVQRVQAAVNEKRRILKMTPAEIGKLQATMYARSMCLSGLSGDRVL